MHSIRRYIDVVETADTLELPNIDVGDTVLVGKWKNRKAEVKGFTADQHNQPVLKTTKGEQKLFKPRLTKLMTEDGPSDEARANIVRCTDDAWRLPNLHTIVPPDQLHHLVAMGLRTVTIYRAVPDHVTAIRPGDWVALSRAYAASHGRGKLLSKRVPAIDVAWAGTDQNEYYYVPLNAD